MIAGREELPRLPIGMTKMWRSIDIESGKVQHLCALLTHCYSSSAINEKTWIIPAGKWLDVLFKNIQLKFLHIINAYNCYNPYSVCSNYVYKDTNVLKTCWTSLNSNTKYKRLFVWIHVCSTDEVISGRSPYKSSYLLSTFKDWLYFRAHMEYKRPDGGLKISWSALKSLRHWEASYAREINLLLYGGVVILEINRRPTRTQKCL